MMKLSKVPPTSLLSGHPTTKLVRLLHVRVTSSQLAERFRTALNTELVLISQKAADSTCFWLWS